MAVKMPVDVACGEVMPAPAAHAEPAAQNSHQNPFVRIVFDQYTEVAGQSLETVTVSYPPGVKSVAHHLARSTPIAWVGDGLC